MGIFFGTDGIRGIVGEDLSYNILLKCGNALGCLKQNCKIIIGRDSRVSGEMLSQSFCLGATLSGANVVDIGIATSPCVSYLTQALNFDFGVVISASHNPSEYNGIKVFDHTGQKLDDKQELIIEKYMVHDLCTDYLNMGEYKYKPGIKKQYVNYVCAHSKSLTGFNIGIDCSNGASKSLAKQIFTKLGANVKFTGMGSGKKINYKCGATYPQRISNFVKKHGLDFGFAFDGDADRIIMVDSCGKVYNGDNILHCLSYSNYLTGDIIVGTSMSNLGLEVALNKRGIKFERADVGDKFVIQKMQELNSNLGGEQAGHIIINSLLPTGDGVFVAVVLSNIVTKQTLNKFMEFSSFPQIIINVSTQDKIRAMGSEELSKAINYATEELAGMGRVLVRPSGTENKIRVMVEAENFSRAEMLAKFVASKIDSKGV